jgi:hypothetical protein
LKVIIAYRVGHWAVECSLASTWHADFAYGWQMRIPICGNGGNIWRFSPELMANSSPGAKGIPSGKIEYVLAGK